MQDAGDPSFSELVARIPAVIFQLRRAAGERERFPVVGGRIRELLSLDPDELRASSAPLWALLSGADAARVAELLAHSEVHLVAGGAEFQVRPPEGEVKWIAAYARPTRGRDGATVWHGFLYEATERRRAQQVDKMNAIARLAGGVAHDLNNLLTAAGSNLDMALNELPVDHAARRYLERSRQASERAADLTRELVAFSRRQVLQLEPLRWNDIVARARAAGRLASADRTDLALELQLDRGAATVLADRDQLEQVLVDLVAHAADATPAGGTLTIATGRREISDAEARGRPGMRAGPHAWLSVRDTGTGFDEQMQAQLFEPFFTTKIVHGASAGLGLAAAYGIVKQLNGYVEVESAPGTGTTFTVYLPEVAETAAEAARAAGGSAAIALHPMAAEVALARPQPNQGGTVLIAEDETSVREPVRRALERFGYLVIDAPDGSAALALAAETGRTIDLLLTDVVMPGMSGRELARRLREHQPAIRVLFMSGYSSEAIATNGMLAPGSAFLQKPFSVAELINRVREALAKEQS